MNFNERFNLRCGSLLPPEEFQGMPISQHVQRWDELSRRAMQNAGDPLTQGAYESLAKAHAEIVAQNATTKNIPTLRWSPTGDATKAVLKKLNVDDRGLVKKWEVMAGTEITHAAKNLTAAAKAMPSGFIYSEMVFNSIILRANPDTSPDDTVAHYHQRSASEKTPQTPVQKLRAKLEQKRKVEAALAEARSKKAALVLKFSHKEPSNDELAEIIRTVSGFVSTFGKIHAKEFIEPLYAAGISGPMHRGKGWRMVIGDDIGFRMQLEWFAGELVDMIESSKELGVNAWINCTDKFTHVSEEQPSFWDLLRTRISEF